tara:strand:- start:77 stop:439 length:363 start_codon:yes stop_codon:yes gene_type:complete
VGWTSKLLRSFPAASTDVMYTETMDIYKISRIDDEPWRFTVYEVNAGDWFVSFDYSPMSAVDACLEILLTPQEKEMAKKDRQFLFDMQAKVQRNYKSFFPRATPINLYAKWQELSDEPST